MLSEQQQRIMGYFIEEAKDHLNTIEQGLLSLQSTIEDPELVSEVFRAAHSVKGGAAMLGLNSIQMTSHRLEDYFKILKECPIQIDQTLENLFLSVFDALKEQLDQLQGPFGLTDDRAAEIMAGVAPVFDSLGQHLSELVAACGGVAPDDVELPTAPFTAPITAQPVTAPPLAQEESSALQLIFQSDIPVRLRDMLQLFKQQDDFDSRGQLQELCQNMAQMGEPFELSEWTTLLNLAAQAIANPDNTYRTLAPIVIKEIKQAQELVLSGRSTAIVPSEALMTLVPEEQADYADDLADLFAAGTFDELDIGSDDELELTTPAASQSFDFDEAIAESDSTLSSDFELPLVDPFIQANEGDISASELSLSDFYPTEETPTSQTDDFEFRANSNGQNERLFSADLNLENVLDPNPSAGHQGPEVGMAELNSLADLFEGEMPDLDTTWQQEEVIELVADGEVDLSDLGGSNDFSDLLFDQDGLDDLTLEDDDDDLSGLLVTVEQLAASAPIESLDYSQFSSGAEPLEDSDTGYSDDLELSDELFPTSNSSGDLLSEAPSDSSSSQELDGFEQLFAGLGESSFSEDSENLPNDLFFFNAEVIDSDADQDENLSFEELPIVATEDLADLISDAELEHMDALESLEQEPQAQPLDTLLDEITAEDEALISELYVTPEEELFAETGETEANLASESAAIPDPWGAASNDQSLEALLADESFDQFGDLGESADLWQEPAEASLTEDLSVEELAELAAEGIPVSAELNEGVDFDLNLFGSEATGADLSSEAVDAEAEESVLDELFSEQPEQEDSVFLTEVLNFENSFDTEVGLSEIFDDGNSLFEEPDNVFPSPADLAQPSEDAIAESEELFSGPVTDLADNMGQSQEVDADSLASEEMDLVSIEADPGSFHDSEFDALVELEGAEGVVEEVDLEPLEDQSVELSTEGETFEQELAFDSSENELSDSLLDFEVEAGDEANIELDTSLDSIGFTDWGNQGSLTDGIEEELELTEAIASIDDSVTEAVEEQEWTGLETLMDASEDVLSTAFDEPSAPVGENDFSDLDALLNEPAAEMTAASNDFADLDALLEQPAPLTPPPSTQPPTIANDFDDLEKLLEDADKTLGGAPARGAALSNARRPSRRSAAALSDQTMRVSVKNLDNLNNLVGELVVNRNSLEQAEDRLRQFLDNLLYQVQQLSDVGQRMRDLYERSLLESSLLSNRRSYQLTNQSDINTTQANHATGLSFDALEMDRFTGFHTLSQEMIELIVRVRESSSDIDFVVDETDQITRNFRQITTQLQEGLTRSRMVPFTQAADRLPRAVRDISMKCGKQAELLIEGRETLIDKMILEQLYDPMTHLVNNAITHGIETPQERQAAGKSPVGKITVRSFHQGNQTVISVMDDGAGIDPERVKAKAIEKGLITPQEAQEMSRLDVYDLLFHHGFSTRDKADDFAGRGVGMDVVRTSLNEIRGVVNIDSAVGRGTTFTIRLPLTLSISKALCCISNRARIAFPMDGVEDMLDIPRDRIQRDEQDRPCIQWRDTLLPFSPLSDLLRYNRNLGRGSVYGGNQEDDIISVVVLRSAGNYLALQIDQVLGEQEIVIKQLEGPVPKPMGVAGATVLGDGRIMPIADVLELIDLSMGRIRRESGSSLWEKDDAQGPAEPIDLKHEPTVLIVDDSITVRELLSMTFNKVGYRVEQARDGQEAWEKLRSGLPCDLVFCDIEMPRMDGLELLSRIQKDPSLEHLPIAMLTSRGADRHRQMAVQLGAKGYFTKPYLEEALLDAAQRMLNGEVLVNTSV